MAAFVRNKLMMIEWPVELVIVAQTTLSRGPIHKHQDLLKLFLLTSGLHCC